MSDMFSILCKNRTISLILHKIFGKYTQYFNNACPHSFKYLKFPRSRKRGGGLAVLFYNKIKISVLTNMQSSFVTFEYAVVSIQSTKSIACCLIYRPPSTSVPRFMSELSDLCSSLLSYDEIIIIGDF
jgi:hypothetical protein